MTILAAACGIGFYRVRRVAGWIFVPYVAWLIYAAHLNYRAYILNPWWCELRNERMKDRAFLYGFSRKISIYPRKKSVQHYQPRPIRSFRIKYFFNNFKLKIVSILASHCSQHTQNKFLTLTFPINTKQLRNCGQTVRSNTIVVPYISKKRRKKQTTGARGTQAWRKLFDYT